VAQPESPADEIAAKAKAYASKHRLGLAALVLFLVSLVVFFGYVNYSERIEEVWSQYNQQSAQFAADARALQMIRWQFIFSMAQADKAKAASGYAIGVTQARVSWAYFERLIRENDGMLRNIGTDTVGKLAEIDAARTAVSSTCTLMSAHLADKTTEAEKAAADALGNACKGGAVK